MISAVKLYYKFGFQTGEISDKLAYDMLSSEVGSHFSVA